MRSRSGSRPRRARSTVARPSSQPLTRRRDGRPRRRPPPLRAPAPRRCLRDTSHERSRDALREAGAPVAPGRRLAYGFGARCSPSARALGAAGRSAPGLLAARRRDRRLRRSPTASASPARRRPRLPRGRRHPRRAPPTASALPGSGPARRTWPHRRSLLRGPLGGLAGRDPAHAGPHFAVRWPEGHVVRAVSEAGSSRRRTSPVQAEEACRRPASASAAPRVEDDEKAAPRTPSRLRRESRGRPLQRPRHEPDDGKFGACAPPLAPARAGRAFVLGPHERHRAELPRTVVHRQPRRLHERATACTTWSGTRTSG